jgi:hypothetical protein
VQNIEETRTNAVSAFTQKPTEQTRPRVSDDTRPRVDLVCGFCSKSFSRVLEQHRANAARYPRPCCSRSCARRLGNADPFRKRGGGATWKPIDATAKADKLRANGRVNYLVRRGSLARPSACQACGMVGRVDGHHDDYGKPDAVVWLCRRCHAARHSALADGGAR